MSRAIDMTKPLSDDDRAYLLARGYDEQVASHDARFENSDHLQVPVELEVDDEDELPPYEEMSLADLQKECRARELPVGGNKAEVIKRLEEHDALVAERQ
jgi:hypothetical protein